MLKSAEKHAVKIKSLNRPYNIKLGWNLFKFNTYGDHTRTIYHGKEYVLLQTLSHFCQACIAMTQPDKAILSVSQALFNRLSYVIITNYGEDNVPQWVCCAIYRFDKKLDWKDAPNTTYKRGRVNYLIAIIPENEFDFQFKQFVQGKKTNVFEKYVEWKY